MTENNVFQQVSQGNMETIKQQTGIEIPVESIPLPSKGLCYSSDHPLCNAETVDIRCMTARDEDLLTSRALIKSGTVLTKLMQSCLINKSIDPDTLLTGDRNAILIAIRTTGYGPEYSVEIQCPKCDDKYENTFSLGNLTIKRLSINPIETNRNLFSFKLPLSKFDVLFKLITGKDENDISREQERKKKLGSQVENNVTSKLLYCIESINGETDKTKISNIVNNLRAGDARALRNYANDIEPGVEMKQIARCSHCGEEGEVDIPLGISFFWPDFGK